MVYSVDAPTLEGEFHKHLQSQRVNLVNPRKEFFAVTMKELEEIVQEHGLQIELTKLAEAKEYRQSLSMRSAAGMQHGTPAPVVEEFPASL